VPVYVLLIIPACLLLAIAWVLWRGRPERRLGDAASVSEHARRMQALAPPAEQRRSRRHRDR
jgi:hypothetical protein